MKLILLFSILTFSTTYHIHAQAKYSLDKDTNRYINWPLYIVKIPGKQTIEPFYLLTDPSSLVSLKMSKDSTQKNIYGKKATYGVITITLKKGTKLLPLAGLLNSFKVSKKDNHLPVFIDSALANHANGIYFTRAEIRSITVDIEKETGMKYINIRSRRPINRNEIYIR